MAKEDDDLRRQAGLRIAGARDALGWSQAELARRVGMAPSTIGNYEQGTRLPGPREATLLGEALGVSPAYILLVEGDDMLLLDAEAEMVRKFRSLPPDEQAKILKLLDGRTRLMAQPQRTKTTPTKTR